MNNAIILAAGKGKRMNTNIQKTVFPLLNKPMIQYLYNTLSLIKSIDKIICVVGYKKEMIEEVLKNKVTYVFQKEQLGSGNAVKCSSNYLKEDGYSLIINGDTPLIEKSTLENLINIHIDNNNDLTFLTEEVDNPSGYGRIIRDDSNHVIEICEEKDLKNNQKMINEINVGVYIINNNVLLKEIDNIKPFNNNNEYYFTDIIKILFTKKYLISAIKLPYDFHLQGINDFKTLVYIESKLSEEIKENHLKNGVFLVNNNTITIDEDVQIGKGTVIFPNSIISKGTIIGENCKIGPNVEIIDSIIENDVVCKHSLIEQSVIKNKASIGPFAHLRMNTIIGEKNRIGNFVEIKNSKIGNNTAVAHLTYIGDTLCGDRVNFGCGSITVNYDGINKHQTTIGNDVFIGCNSNLIAPVNIGNNVFIAAGSTITSSLEDNDFSIARSRQTTKKNYSLKYKTNIK